MLTRADLGALRMRHFLVKSLGKYFEFQEGFDSQAFLICGGPYGLHAATFPQYGISLSGMGGYSV